MDCDQCGRDLAGLPYTCQRCGESFCSEHRLPEEHDCEELKIEQAERALKREAGEAEPWFNDDTDRAARAVRNQPNATSTDQTTERRRAVMWMLALLGVGVVLAGVLVYGV